MLVPLIDIGTSTLSSPELIVVLIFTSKVDTTLSAFSTFLSIFLTTSLSVISIVDSDTEDELVVVELSLLLQATIDIAIAKHDIPTKIFLIIILFLLLLLFNFQTYS